MHETPTPDTAKIQHPNKKKQFERKEKTADIERIMRKIKELTTTII